MRRTGKLTAAGTLDIVAGFLLGISLLGVPLGYGVKAVLEDYFLMSFMAILGTFAILAVAGGICALRRRLWVLALTGSIFAVFGYGLGIPAIILVSLSKNEFVPVKLAATELAPGPSPAQPAGSVEHIGWTTLCKRVGLWEGHPRPSGLKSFLWVWGSDSGSVEYNGSILRFTGKKLQIDIPVIKNISEVRANPKLVHFLLYFVSLVVVFWLLARWSFVSRTADLLVSITLALLGTVFSWWYLRKYGGWAG